MDSNKKKVERKCQKLEVKKNEVHLLPRVIKVIKSIKDPRGSEYKHILSKVGENLKSNKIVIGESSLRRQVARVLRQGIKLDIVKKCDNKYKLQLGNLKKLYYKKPTRKQKDKLMHLRTLQKLISIKQKVIEEAEHLKNMKTKRNMSTMKRKQMKTHMHYENGYHQDKYYEDRQKKYFKHGKSMENDMSKRKKKTVRLSDYPVSIPNFSLANDTDKMNDSSKTPQSLYFSVHDMEKQQGDLKFENETSSFKKKRIEFKSESETSSSEENLHDISKLQND